MNGYFQVPESIRMKIHERSCSRATGAFLFRKLGSADGLFCVGDRQDEGEDFHVLRCKTYVSVAHDDA
jgi:hypothetical protein